LTAHREEFEQKMKAQPDAFTVTTNAAIAVSDQAFLSQALPIDPGTVLLDAPLTASNGSVYLRGAEFKTLHENLLKAVLGALQARPQENWPLVVHLKLQATVSGASTSATSVVESLEVPIKLLR
jgi:hypothetical protein